MKKSIGGLVLAMSLMAQTVGAIPVATDVVLNRLAEKSIVEKGVQNLDRVVTRGEAATFLAASLQQNEYILWKENGHPFTDIPQAAYDEIAGLYAAQIIQGVGERQFGYVQKITLREFLVMVMRAFRDTAIDGDSNTFPLECQALLGGEDCPIDLRNLDRPLTYGNMIYVGYLGIFIEPEMYSGYLKQQRAVDYCKIGEWVYYVCLGESEGFHRYNLATQQDEWLRTFEGVSVNGSTAITSEVYDTHIRYRIQAMGQMDEQGTVETYPSQFYLLSLDNHDLTQELIGRVQSTQINQMMLDEVEWLTPTSDNLTRIKALGLHPRRDFPSGFYIYNEKVEFKTYQCNKTTTYELIGEDGMTRIPVFWEDFKRHLDEHQLYQLTCDPEGNIRSVREVDLS